MGIPFYYKVGITVRTNENLKHHGGKVGTVVSRNIETFGDTEHVEYGVAFHSKRHIDAWFLQSELDPIVDISPAPNLEFG
jgi:hypothetical protein